MDLSHLGLKLYIKGENTEGKREETGLPDFRIKVTNPVSYKMALLEPENGLESIGYVKSNENPNVYIRESKAMLSPAEFIQIFGKEAFTQENLVELPMDEVAHKGYLIDFSQFRLNYSIHHFEGRENPSLLLTCSDNTELSRNFLSSLIDTLHEVSSVNNELPLNTDPLFYGRDRIKTGAFNGNQDYYLYVNNYPLSLLETTLFIEEKAIEHKVKFDKWTYQPLNSTVDARQKEQLDKTLVELERNFRPTHEYYGLEPKHTDSFLTSLSKDFAMGTKMDITPKDKFYLWRLKDRESRTIKQSLEKGLFKKGTFNRTFGQDGFNTLKASFSTDEFATTEYRSSEVEVAFSTLDELKDYYEIADDQVDSMVEVFKPDDSKDALVVFDEQGYIYYRSVVDPVEQMITSPNGIRHSLYVVELLNIIKETRNNLEMKLNVINDSPEFDDIEAIQSLVPKLKAEEKTYYGNMLWAEVEFNPKRYEPSNKTLAQIDPDLSALFNKAYNTLNEKIKAHEDAQKSLELEKSKQDALDAIKEFKERGGEPLNSSDKRIEDYGEKIGGAVKDDYRFIKNNMAKMSLAQMNESLAKLDDEDIAGLAKKSILLEPIDPIELKNNGVIPEVAYVMKSLLGALSADSVKAGVPAKEYIHSIKKVEEILYRHQGVVGVRNYIDTVRDTIKEEVLLEGLTQDTSYFSRPQEMDSIIYSYSAQFDSFEEIVEMTHRINAIKESDNKTEKEKVFLEMLDNLSKRGFAPVMKLYDELKAGQTTMLGKNFMSRLRKPHGFSVLARENTSNLMDSWSKLITPAVIKRHNAKHGIEESSEDNADVMLKESSESTEVNDTDENALFLSIKQAILDAKGQLPVVKHLGHVVREGEDYGLEDIDEKTFAETFGFRAVEFGEWLPQKERKEVLKRAFESFIDLTKACGMSELKRASLGEQLAMAFGSRGRSSALAHYEKGRNVINLTRMKGAGSLAHEMGHAIAGHLVNYLSDKHPKFNLLTKGRDFIERLIVDNADSRKKSVQMNDVLIAQMSNCIEDDNDKQLFLNYTKVIEGLIFKRDSEESRIDRLATRLFEDKGYGLRALSNTRYWLRNSLTNLFNENIDDKNILRRALNEKHVDSYLEKVVYPEVFPILDIQNEIEDVFNKYKEALIVNDRYSDARTEVVIQYESECQSVISGAIQKSIDAFDTAIHDVFKLSPDAYEVLERQFGGLMSIDEKEISSPMEGSHLSFTIRSQLMNTMLDEILMTNHQRNFKGTIWGYLEEQAINIADKYLVASGLYQSYKIEHTEPEISLNYNMVETEFFQNADRLDARKGSGSSYYRSPVELFARAFESFVLDELDKKGERNDYLVSSGKHPDKYPSSVVACPYPLNNRSRERDNINENMKSFMAEYDMVMKSQLEQSDDKDMAM